MDDIISYYVAIQYHLKKYVQKELYCSLCALPGLKYNFRWKVNYVITAIIKITSHLCAIT